ncbi:MAG: GerMN domain-containing protein [Spirochaetales bacterium]|uniref:GerMN domain-containing protein n=1 Tax=Candidatus Thalassospirochaeta sargassi TaxID=3119039 RepID=A0AAJ1IF84_9SPIO|nr:GerMN domain-containing protein [Spirochaetales bacterium]
MTLKRFSRKFIILLALFVAFFLVTLVFITLDAESRVERVLFFPDEEGRELHGELRRLPVRDSRAGNIELYINEIILGPATIDLYRLIPQGVKLESLLVDDEVLYLGFSENLVTTAENVPMSFNGIIEGVEKAVVFNFPEIKEVKTAIGGEPAVIR